MKKLLAALVIIILVWAIWHFLIPIVLGILGAIWKWIIICLIFAFALAFL